MIQRIYAAPSYFDCHSKMNKLLTVLTALFVASVTHSTVLAQEIKGDVAAGSQKNAMCLGCHGIVGFHTGFPQVHRVPKISGQGAKYISAALADYKKGDRKHPSMRVIADSLSAQDMADLAAYYEANGTAQGAATPGNFVNDDTKAKELIAKGGCTSCHGENFSKPIDPSYPKIAGQYNDYLLVALKAYKTEKANLIGRANPIMAGMVKQFSNAELEILANYIGSLPGGLKTVPQAKFQ